MQRLKDLVAKRVVVASVVVVILFRYQWVFWEIEKGNTLEFNSAYILLIVRISSDIKLRYNRCSKGLECLPTFTIDLSLVGEYPIHGMWDMLQQKGFSHSANG